jgi:hypothetical protein
MQVETLHFILKKTRSLFWAVFISLFALTQCPGLCQGGLAPTISCVGVVPGCGENPWELDFIGQLNFMAKIQCLSPDGNSLSFLFGQCITLVATTNYPYGVKPLLYAKERLATDWQLVRKGRWRALDRLTKLEHLDELPIYMRHRHRAYGEYRFKLVIRDEESGFEASREWPLIQFHLFPDRPSLIMKEGQLRDGVPLNFNLHSHTFTGSKRHVRLVAPMVDQAEASDAWEQFWARGHVAKESRVLHSQVDYQQWIESNFIDPMSTELLGYNVEGYYCTGDRDTMPTLDVAGIYNNKTLSGARMLSITQPGSRRCSLVLREPRFCGVISTLQRDEPVGMVVMDNLETGCLEVVLNNIHGDELRVEFFNPHFIPADGPISLADQQAIKAHVLEYFLWQEEPWATPGESWTDVNAPCYWKMQDKTPCYSWISDFLTGLLADGPVQVYRETFYLVKKAHDKVVDIVKDPIKEQIKSFVWGMNGYLLMQQEWAEFKEDPKAYLADVYGHAQNVTLTRMEQTLNDPRAAGALVFDVAVSFIALPVKFAGNLKKVENLVNIFDNVPLANKLPDNLEFARVIKPEQVRALQQGKPMKLSTYENAAETFITTSEALPKGMTKQELARMLTIDKENVGGILRFKLEGKDLNGIATPYDRFEMKGFVNGGRTDGGLPEYVIPNRPIKDLNYEIEFLE